MANYCFLVFSDIELAKSSDLDRMFSHTRYVDAGCQVYWIQGIEQYDMDEQHFLSAV